ncbi:MAG: alpha/beta hydrolase [Bacteroidota bacterium]|nr:alpha/beta hydrolase [Bacteroidota bacterium]
MKINILPGLNNSGSGHWQTNWQVKYGFYRVEQEDWAQPDFQKWKNTLINYLTKDKDEKDNILIAHSLGCLLVVKSLPEIREYVKGIFLVAPADPNGELFPRQLQAFNNLPDHDLGIPGYLIFSGDDPYASVSFAEKYGLTWGLKTVNIGRKGHINSESALGDWEEGFDYLGQLLGTVLTVKNFV